MKNIALLSLFLFFCTAKANLPLDNLINMHEQKLAHVESHKEFKQIEADCIQRIKALNPATGYSSSELERAFCRASWLFTPKLLEVIAEKSSDPIEKLVNSTYDTQGTTPLMMAVSSGNIEAARWLIVNGAHKGDLYQTPDYTLNIKDICFYTLKMLALESVPAQQLNDYLKGEISRAKFVIKVNFAKYGSLIKPEAPFKACLMLIT